MAHRASLWVLLLCALPGVAGAASWWNSDWQFRKEVGFDLSAQGADIQSSPADVPVLIRLSLANFNFFNDAKPDGSDFRVIASDDKTPLKFHFERYDAQNQMALLWVRVPRLAGGAKSDRVYVYYGNPKAPAAADVAGSYDNDQALVLHFGEAQGLPQDATAYKNNASASTAELSAASLIAGGAKFAGAQSVTVPATATLRLIPAAGLTASAWVKADQPQAQADVLAFEDGPKDLVLGIDGAKAFARLSGLAGGTVLVRQATDLAVGQWHHLAMRVGDGALKLFVDGAEVGSAPAAPVEMAGALTVGASGHNSNYLSGEVDEVEVAKVARSADWIKAAARGQAADGPLVLFGADGQREGGAGLLLRHDRQEPDGRRLGGDRDLSRDALPRDPGHGRQGSVPRPHRGREQEVHDGVPQAERRPARARQAGVRG